MIYIKLIKNEKYISSVALVAFQMFNRHMWQVATIVDSATLHHTSLFILKHTSIGKIIQSLLVLKC